MENVTIRLRLAGVAGTADAGRSEVERVAVPPAIPEWFKKLRPIDA